MPYKIIGKDKNDPVLTLTLENDVTVRIPVRDTTERGRHRLGKVLETEFNRIIRQTAIHERDRIQEGIKSLLGIKGTGRQG